MRTHEGGKKQNLEREINELKTQIRLITNGSTKAPKGFDWAVELAEVFADGGFDIQVANPPYVRQELIKDLKPTLQKVYPTTYNGTSDLYCFFYARALQLLKVGGMLAFISPNKWFRAKYGEKLRKYIADTCRVHSITDFGELPVFKSAATFPMIFVCQNGEANKSTIFTQVKSLQAPYPDVLAIIRDKGETLPNNALNGSSWTLTDTSSANRLKKMEESGITLGEYVNGQIYYGVKTGFNKAFVIDGAKRAELIAQDSKSTEIIKPLAIGDDVRKWCINYKDKWLIFTRRGINIDAYPAIKTYLAQWRTELEPKPRNWSNSSKWEGRKSGSYKWYEIQDEVAYYAAFDKPKIVYPVIAKESRFALDTKGAFTNDKAFIITVPDLYLLGVLNSSSIWKYLKNLCSVLGDADKGGRLELRAIYISKIPIPNASTTEREAISQLVQKCLDAKGVNCEAWEKEISDRVAALYGL